MASLTTRNNYNMETVKINSLLSDYDPVEVERFVAYCNRLRTEKYTSGERKGTLKNPWMQYRTAEELARAFKHVESEGLVLDGVQITLNMHGISYGYIAYKNKMLLAYPESLVDLTLVYTGDKFDFSKKSGKVVYSHEIADPFSRESKDVIGGYCVIKNMRGEFLTTLTRKDFEKHRKIAKTDHIWRNWYEEMCLKTLIKKACKQHFEDIYRAIEQQDNSNYDLDKVNETQQNEEQRITDAIKALESSSDINELKVQWNNVGPLRKYAKVHRVKEAMKSKLLST